MTIDKRVEHNTISVLALADLLRDVIKSATLYHENDVLRNALRSQGALSKFTDESRGIYASSLNTIKRIAESVLDGGFDGLNRLRRSAYDSIEAERCSRNRPKTNSKANLQDRIKQLSQENEQVQQDLLLLSMILQRSLSQSLHYAHISRNEKVLALCKQEQQELLDMLSLRQHPVSTNVIQIRE